MQRFVKQWPPVVGLRRHPSVNRVDGHLTLFGGTPRLGGTGFKRRVTSHAVEPIAKRSSAAQAGRLAHQHEKRRLKRVLGIVMMVQDPPANAQHHGGMPSDQRRKRRLIALSDKALQKLAVAYVGVGLSCQAEAKLAQK